MHIWKRFDNNETTNCEECECGSSLPGWLREIGKYVIVYSWLNDYYYNYIKALKLESPNGDDDDG